MSLPTRRAIARAIAYIEECRKTHVDWAEWVERAPEEAAEPRPQVETGGDAEHHRGWVAKYDHVLSVLRAAAAPTPPRRRP
jgi:hypothetical protein